MHEITPTVRVKEKASGRNRVINLSDFDSELHETAVEEKAVKKKVPALKVEKLEDGKFIVVDAKGKKQGEEVFEKEEDAQALVDMLAGN